MLRFHVHAAFSGRRKPDPARKLNREGCGIAPQGGSVSSVLQLINARGPTRRQPGYSVRMVSVRSVRGKYLNRDSQLSGLQKRLAFLKTRRAVSHRRISIPLRRWLTRGRGGCIGLVGLSPDDGQPGDHQQACYTLDYDGSTGERLPLECFRQPFSFMLANHGLPPCAGKRF